MDIRKPSRATRTFTQQLQASRDQVFPLLCPVREADWLEGWDPLFVLTNSGAAEPECVFMTRAAPHPAIWFVTRHEPERGFVEMLKISPEVTACRLQIQLADAPGGCAATITYSHTSLGDEGDRFVAGFTEEFYAGFMREWETRMNHYLKTGKALPGAS
jgi:hypothetical protein